VRRRDSSRVIAEGDDGGVVRSARSRVEEFAPDGSDHALSERVATGVRRDEDLGKTMPSPASKLSAEDTVRFTDEKPGRRVVREGLDNLLRRPSHGWSVTS